MRKIKALFATAVATVVTAPAVFAAEGSVDYTSLTDKFDIASVGVGVLAIGGLVLGVYGTMKGAKMIINMVKSA